MARNVASEMSVEEELLEATGEKPLKEGESQTKYVKRLLTAVDALPDKDWQAFTEDTQNWLADAIKAGQKGKAYPPFPDAEDAAEDDETASEEDAEPEDEEDEKPAKKPSAKDEEDDEEEPEDSEDSEDDEKPVKKPVAKDSEDPEDDEAPPAKRGPGRPRKIAADVEDDEEAPPKRKPGRPRKEPVEEVEEDEAPVVKRGPGRPRKEPVDEDDKKPAKPVKKPVVEDDDEGEEKPVAAKAAVTYLRKLVCKYPERSLEKLQASLEAKDFELSDQMAKVIQSDTLATLNVLESLKMLCDPE